MKRKLSIPRRKSIFKPDLREKAKELFCEIPGQGGEPLYALASVARRPAHRVAQARLPEGANFTDHAPGTSDSEVIGTYPTFPGPAEEQKGYDPLERFGLGHKEEYSCGEILVRTGVSNHGFWGMLKRAGVSRNGNGNISGKDLAGILKRTEGSRFVEEAVRGYMAGRPHHEIQKKAREIYESLNSCHYWNLGIVNIGTKRAPVYLVPEDCLEGFARRYHLA